MSALTPEELGSLPLFAWLTVEQLKLLLDRHRVISHQLDQVIVMDRTGGNHCS